jgi:hypothetical protein
MLGALSSHLIGLDLAYHRTYGRANSEVVKESLRECGGAGGRPTLGDAHVARVGTRLAAGNRLPISLCRLAQRAGVR